MTSVVGKLRSSLRPFRQRAQKAYVERFHAFSRGDLLDTLRGLGIEAGDVVAVHSSFDRFLGFQGNAKDALEVLQESVGLEGGLVMPTQPFGGSAIEYARRQAITDLRRSPSRMGFLTELLRRTKGAARSVNPTHPVAAWGRTALTLIDRDWEASTPCGQGTAYHRLLDCDARILTLGTGIQPITFYHCVEELIEPSMPHSPFTTEVFTLQTRDADGEIYTSRMRLYESGLSARRRMDLMIPELKTIGAWQATRVGRLEVVSIKARDVLRACQNMAARGEFCYLPES